MEEFDDIFDKEITKRYAKHEIQYLSKRKNKEKQAPEGLSNLT